MVAKETMANTFGTLVTVVIAIICGAFIRYKIINSASHGLTAYHVEND